MKPQTVRTLILKGGGIKGLAFAGALDVLAEAGFQFDTYVGTSAGAVATVLLAAGYSSKELGDILSKTEFGAFLDAGRVTSIYNFLFRGGLYPGDRLSQWVTTTLRKRPKLADTVDFPQIRMRNLSEGADRDTRAIVFASHSLVGTFTFDSSGEHDDSLAEHAVRLSCSIPGFFIPGNHEGYRVYDGGLLHNFPIEVYQRVRGPVPPGAEEDFIALYLGKNVPDKLRPWWKRWWVLEMLEIMLARDDTIVLTKFKERSIVVDTAPIKTTDFKLSAVEKQLLIKRGRTAALGFLQKYVSPKGYAEQYVASQADEVDLFKQVKLTRRKRYIIRWTLRFLIVIIIGFSLYKAKTFTTARFVPPRYEEDRTIKFQSHYIDTSDRIQELPRNAVQEIADVYGDYPNELTDGCLRFEDVTQFVVHNYHANTNRVSAVKLVVFDGKADVGGGHRKVKISSSVANNKLTVAGFLFSFKGDKWVSIEPKFRHVADKKNVKEFEFDVANDTPDIVGLPIKLVLLTTYDEVFGMITNGVPAPVTPWILHAHRFLSSKGKATYMFLSDSVDTVTFPGHLYTKISSDAFSHLQCPDGTLNGRDRWTRISPAVEFLKSQAFKKAVGAYLLPAVTNVVNQVEIAQTKNAKRQADGSFAFSFDRINTSLLDASRINLLLFAERPEE